MNDWKLTEYDQEIFKRELAGFIPSRIFDAHAHLYDLDHFHEDDDIGYLAGGPKVAGVEAYDSMMSEMMPGCSLDALFFPYPRVNVNFEATNEFVSNEVSKKPRSRAQMLVSPEDDPEVIRETVKSKGFVGLKPYHLFSSHNHTPDSRIEDFLPESQVRIAHEEGLTITLHIVRRRALADPVNQITIRRYAENYPDMRLILAHAARGFNSHHTIEGIESLTGLTNVYFDTCAVSDPGANEAIIRTMGHQALLFGSDFPCTHQRARPVGVGDTFQWIYANNVKSRDGAIVQGSVDGLTMLAFESLRALKIAAISLNLTEGQIEDIFFNNAARLLRL